MESFLFQGKTKCMTTSDLFFYDNRSLISYFLSFKDENFEHKTFS